MLRYVVPVLIQYMNPIFVETGTYQGDGVETALRVGFQRVISIEVFDGFCKACQEKFASDSRVTIIQGDSAVILGDVIKGINQPITFWLDGHAFPEDDAPLGTGCPLIQELGHIAEHFIKNHVILIDDITNLVKGGAYKNSALDRKDVEDVVLRINPAYKISYFNRGGTDVLVASI